MKICVREGEGATKPINQLTNARQRAAGSWQRQQTHQLGGIDDTKLEATDSAQPDG